MERTYAEMSNRREFGGDKRCITRMLADVPGGVTLDLTGYTGGEIKEGHVITRNGLTGVYKPLNVNGEDYDSLEEGFVPVGLAIGTTPAGEPLIGVMTMGQVVKERCPYLLEEQWAQQLSQIQFI